MYITTPTSGALLCCTAMLLQRSNVQRSKCSKRSPLPFTAALHCSPRPALLPQRCSAALHCCCTALLLHCRAAELRRCTAAAAKHCIAALRCTASALQHLTNADAGRNEARGWEQESRKGREEHGFFMASCRFGVTCVRSSQRALPDASAYALPATRWPCLRLWSFGVYWPAPVYMS